MKICIAGAGYVGLSLSTMLSVHHEVRLIEINKDKIKLLAEKKSPIVDEQIENYLKNNDQLAKKIDTLKTDKTPRGISQLESSVTYSIAMAYVHYKRANVKIKNPTDVVELAEIHKKYYNTYKGKTKVSESIKKTLNTGLIAKK